ncbi:MAG: type I-E CRISPR-associated endoribonuclease Cas2e [Clostridiales bacterium]|jgi:CRISPR-associated protein Cas2|nr:type I-E CRISPR-associated endoribonuclease Cas2e [Clostridiales bacterium]
MLVLTLTDCPIGLRGDLTKWLFEIDAGVFVGQINARVREELWDRIKETCRNGRAVLVYNAEGEQRLTFRVHGSTWEPIDFDGIKLMLRPSPSRLKEKQKAASHGFSDAAKRRAAKRFSPIRARYPDDYVVVDVETTGLEPETDELLEIGALKVSAHEIIDTFQSIIHIERPIPPHIKSLTGITDERVHENGRPILDVLNEFFAFIGALPIVAHNVDFDTGFLLSACARHGLRLFSNRCIDTLSLAKRLIKDIPDHKLGTLANYFNLPQNNAHRSLGDCQTTKALFEKLIIFASIEDKN